MLNRKAKSLSSYNQHSYLFGSSSEHELSLERPALEDNGELRLPRSVARNELDLNHYHLLRLLCETDTEIREVFDRDLDSLYSLNEDQHAKIAFYTASPLISYACLTELVLFFHKVLVVTAAKRDVMRALGELLNVIAPSKETFVEFLGSYDQSLSRLKSLKTRKDNFISACKMRISDHSSVTETGLAIEHLPNAIKELIDVRQAAYQEKNSKLLDAMKRYQIAQEAHDQHVETLEFKKPGELLGLFCDLAAQYHSIYQITVSDLCVFEGKAIAVELFEKPTKAQKKHCRMLEETLRNMVKEAHHEFSDQVAVQLAQEKRVSSEKAPYHVCYQRVLKKHKELMAFREGDWGDCFFINKHMLERLGLADKDKSIRFIKKSFDFVLNNTMQRKITQIERETLQQILMQVFMNDGKKISHGNMKRATTLFVDNFNAHKVNLSCRNDELFRWDVDECKNPFLSALAPTLSTIESMGLAQPVSSLPSTYEVSNLSLEDLHPERVSSVKENRFYYTPPLPSLSYSAFPLRKQSSVNCDSVLESSSVKKSLSSNTPPKVVERKSLRARTSTTLAQKCSSFQGRSQTPTLLKNNHSYEDQTEFFSTKPRDKEEITSPPSVLLHTRLRKTFPKMVTKGAFTPPGMSKLSTPGSPFSRSQSSFSSSSSSLGSESMMLGESAFDFKERVYILKCYCEPEQIALFFDSDLNVSEKVSTENKKMFFQIILQKLTQKYAQQLMNCVQHRVYLKSQLDLEKGQEIIAYIKAVERGEMKVKPPYSEEEMLNMVKMHVLCALKESALFFESLFSADRVHEQTLDKPRVFALVITLEIGEKECGPVAAQLMRFLQSSALLLSTGIAALNYLLISILRFMEDNDYLCRALLRTRKGRMLLCQLGEKEAKDLLQLLQEKQWDVCFFEALLQLFRDEKDDAFELSAFADKRELQMSAVNLLKSEFFHIQSFGLTSDQRKNIVQTMLGLNAPSVDANLCANEALLSEIDMLGLRTVISKRVKAWFTFDALMDKPEVQRAFGSNQTLAEASQKKLDVLRTQPFLTMGQVQTIYHMEFGLALNRHKQAWITYYKANLHLLIEHWAAERHLDAIVLIKRDFEEAMLDNFLANTEDAYDPKNYRLEYLPEAVTNELPQDIRRQYDFNLNIMLKIYHTISSLRKENGSRITEETPRLEGYRIFSEIARYVWDDLISLVGDRLTEQLKQCFLHSARERMIVVVTSHPGDSIYLRDAYFEVLVNLLRENAVMTKRDQLNKKIIMQIVDTLLNNMLQTGEDNPLHALDCGQSSPV